MRQSESFRKLIADDLHASTGRAGFRAVMAALLFNAGFSLIFFHRCATALYGSGYRRLGMLLWRWNTAFSGCHLSLVSNLGGGLSFPHPTGVVIGDGVVLGRHVTVYQNVTVGRGRGDCSYPKIGDGVIIFPSSVVFGDIAVAAGAVVGAGSVVCRDVQAEAVVCGNPAKEMVNPNRSA